MRKKLQIRRKKATKVDLRETMFFQNQMATVKVKFRQQLSSPLRITWFKRARLEMLGLRIFRKSRMEHLRSRQFASQKLITIKKSWTKQKMRRQQILLKMKQKSFTLWASTDSLKRKKFTEETKIKNLKIWIFFSALWTNSTEQRT